MEQGREGRYNCKKGGERDEARREWRIGTKGEGGGGGGRGG